MPRKTMTRSLLKLMSFHGMMRLWHNFNLTYVLPFALYKHICSHMYSLKWHGYKLLVSIDMCSYYFHHLESLEIKHSRNWRKAKGCNFH